MDGLISMKWSQVYTPSLAGYGHRMPIEISQTLLLRTDDLAWMSTRNSRRSSLLTMLHVTVEYNETILFVVTWPLGAVSCRHPVVRIQPFFITWSRASTGIKERKKRFTEPSNWTALLLLRVIAIRVKRIEYKENESRGCVSEGKSL